jgi:hypothetical protein
LCYDGSMSSAAGLLRIPNCLEIVSLLTGRFSAEDPEPTPRKLLDEIVYYEVYGGQTSNGHVTPGVPETVPPGPAEKLMNWPRRVFGPPVWLAVSQEGRWSGERSRAT